MRCDLWIFTLISLNLCVSRSYGQQPTYATSQTNQVTGICIGCGVVNPNNPINNSNLTDYSTFTITAGLLNVSVSQTLIFPAASSTGCDSLIIGIGSGNTLLSVALFGGVKVETLLGSTSNNDSQTISTGILRLLECNTRAEVHLRPGRQFDRVKVTVSSSLLGLLQSFRLYYAYKKNSVPDPLFFPPEGVNCGAPKVPVLNHQPGINYNVQIIYAAFFNPVFDTAYTVINSDTITLPFWTRFAGAQGDIYVQAVNSITGCTSDTVRHAYFAGSSSALPLVNADSVHICRGDSVTLVASQAVNNPLYSLLWYDAPAGGNLLFTGASYRVSPAATDTFYVAGRASCEYPFRAPVKIQVTQKTPPVLADDTLFVTINTTDTLRAISPAGATFRWYTAPTGGTLLFTGNKFAVTPVTLDAIIYYVESELNGCISSSRTRAIVKPVNSLRMTTDKQDLPGPLEVYPNPTTGYLRFKGLPAAPGSMLTVSDLHGHILLQRTLQNNYQVLPSTLPAGTYLLQLRTPDRKIHRVKIILNRE